MSVTLIVKNSDFHIIFEGTECVMHMWDTHFCLLDSFVDNKLILISNIA